MKYVLALEYAALLVVSIYVFSLLEFSWWLYAVFFFAPDIGMLGYVVNPKVGAYMYNFFHHQAVAVGAYALGLFVASPELLLCGVIILGHASFDRLMGYGLKYTDSFRHTHLGNL